MILARIVNIQLVAETVGCRVGHQLALKIIGLPWFLFIAERKNIGGEANLFCRVHHAIHIFPMLLGYPVQTIELSRLQCFAHLAVDITGQI